MEKEEVLEVIIAILAICLCLAVISSALWAFNDISNEINERGLKSIVNDIWNGKENAPK